MTDLNQRKKIVQLAISFWIGAGLMSIINAWKINQNMNPLGYSRIMSGVSAVLLIASVIYLIIINREIKRSAANGRNNIKER